MLVIGFIIVFSLAISLICSDGIQNIFGYLLIGQAANLLILSIAPKTLLTQALILTSLVISLGLAAIFLKKS